MCIKCCDPELSDNENCEDLLAYKNDIKGESYKFNWCDITIGEGINMSGEINLKFVEKSDGQGNELAPADRPTFYHELDSYQAYKLAMSILKRVEVVDTRGNR